GTLMNLLVARGIPSQALYSDICYRGGETVNGSDYWYSPELNAQAAQLLFDNLPSWYKPDFSTIRGYITADARRLPFDDNSVDYIVTDPPYGKNLASAGLGVVCGSLPEFNRVAKEGSILLIPLAWVKEIKATGADVKQLTGDLSKGHSKTPVCYVLVKKHEEDS
ncbi:MAG TPA: hypothetical protein VFW90_00845, partial [Candidatus Saccharimonadales bacterium]|nr:hypothetical protein [Candidatus Saccharimonadales bacterium]